MTSQSEKAQAFEALHQQGTFVIPNPYDTGSGVMLQSLGFKALATTSAGYAQTLGRLDGQISLKEKLEHCRSLCAATEIPVAADFENGFADSPEDAARNLLKVAEAGVVGASIEDFSGSEIYDCNLAVDRIAACAQEVSALDFPFTLTARAENLLRGVNDMDDTIKRLQAFQAAGADVLYSPGLATLEQIQLVMDSVDKPINVLVAFIPDIPVAEYTNIGVRRLSIGGGLANYVIGALVNAAREMSESGSFSWMKEAASGGSIKKMLS